MNNQNTNENKKKWGQIVAKAWMDEKFKRKLLSSPKEVLQECGIDCGSMTINIIEQKQNELCMFLPHKPAGNLSESELKNIAAASDPTCNNSSMCD